MKGDRLLIHPEHTARAADIVEQLADVLQDRAVITVAGESGAGKSELGTEIALALNTRDIPAAVIQQDDYFVFPPKTNHEMRRRNLEQVGLYEVKLGLLDGNLRSFKRGDNPIYKPVVDYDADSIAYVEVDFSDHRVLVVEGTYTTTLEFADWRVFIDRTFEQTRAHREARGRDSLEPFVESVLRTEHEIIASHRPLADFVVASDFQSVARQRTSAS
ncbi:MAG: hypothetical protein KJO07_22820 [Deltaproteobacteria bacterium]|nr:hypothetical protein [Deltaproteobacteria bacterium]